MSTCISCGVRGALKTADVNQQVLIQTDDGGLVVTDLPKNMSLEKCGSCGALNLSSEQESQLANYLFSSDSSDNKGLRIRIKKPRITVRAPVTVRGTSVTVGSVSVTGNLPQVTVEGVKFPEVRIGTPTLPSENPNPPDYKVFKQCRYVDGDAEVYIVNQENHPVLVVVNVGGMLLPESVVNKQSERLFGKFKAKTCEEVETYVALWSVSTE